MNTAICVSRFISALSLSAALTVTAAAAKEPKPKERSAKQLDRLIDAMASRNKEPKIVETRFGNEVPIFPDKYDWSEQDRVSRALETVIKDTSDELWWRLKKHFHDDRYCLTGNEGASVEMDAWNFSVGDLCRHIAEAKLGAPYRRHFIWLREKLSPPFNPQEVFWGHRKDWAGKPLYLIQIAVCRRAIKEMKKAETVMPYADSGERFVEEPITSAEKSDFIAAVKKEIKHLKRRKRAVLPKEINLSGFECDEFDSKLAEKAKKRLKEEGILKDESGGAAAKPPK
jgi:hypothetical protein